jgi:Holliday junction resolvasome RuvABC endonuclease subunit
LSAKRLTTPGILVALDLSLEHTGYAVMDLTTGVIRKGLIEPNGPKGPARLGFVRQRILNLVTRGNPDWVTEPHTCIKDDGGTPGRRCTACDWEKPRPCLVLIEGYAFSMHSRSVTGLAELGGVVRLALHDAQIPFLEIPPSQLKKYLTGRGNAPKQIMLKEVFKRYGPEGDIDDDNIADAFALLQLGCALVDRPTRPLVQFQEQVVNDIVKSVLKTPVVEKAA